MIENEENMPAPKDGDANKKREQRRADLPDNAHDEERMQPEEINMDLPDVKDIPGQENIVPPVLDSFTDVTISSDDEEGVGIFGDDEESEDSDTEIMMGTEADVTATDKNTLQRADEDMPDTDDQRLRSAALDSTDADGVPLNEGSLATSVSGDDLDTATTKKQDVDDDPVTQSDEENATYSLGSASNDNITEGTP